MDDLVLAEARACCEKLCIPHVRFNFRGVGASEGRHDSSDAEYNGEVEDLKAVLSWTRTEFRAERVIGIGYSFGSFIINRGDQLNLFDKSVLIAPPNISMSFIFDNPERPCDIVMERKILTSIRKNSQVKPSSVLRLSKTATIFFMEVMGIYLPR